MTPYQYVTNNPIMRVNPTGMSKVSSGGPCKRLLDGAIWLGSAIATSVYNAYSTYKEKGLGGFAFYGSDRLGKRDKKLLGEGNRFTEWLDAGGFVNNSFNTGGPKVSKSTEGPSAKKTEELLNQARKFVEVISDGKKTEEGMKFLDKVDTVIEFTIQRVKNIDLDNKEIEVKNEKVKVNTKNYLDLNKKLDSLENLNQREIKYKEAWTNNGKINIKICWIQFLDTSLIV